MFGIRFYEEKREQEERLKASSAFLKNERGKKGMAQDPKAVGAKIKALRGDRLQFVGKEVGALPGILHDGEELRAIGSGLIGPKNHLLVVTDKRVLILYKGKDIEVQSFSPEQVGEYSFHKNLLSSDLTVLLAGNTVKIGGLDKGHAQAAAAALKELADALLPVTEENSSDDTLTRLERITSLRDKGALTEEEFATQKKIILTGVAPSRSDAAQPAVPPVPEKEKPKEKQSAQKEPPAQPDVQVTAPQTAPASPRKSGCLKKVGWGILILLVILYFLGKSNEKDAQPPTGTTEQQAPKQSEPTLSAEPAKKAPAPAATVAEYDLLPYSYQGREDISTTKRRRGRVSLVLNDTDETVSREKLAATCMAAAKHYAKEFNLPVLAVILYDQPGTNWEHVQLANCDYSPDGGGWSGSQGWTWDQVIAADRTTTKTERAIGRLWTQMRGKYQSPDGTTNEAALSKAIAKKLGIKSSEVHLAYLFLEGVPTEKLEGVPAQGPTKQAVVESKSDQWSTKTLKAELRDLLNEFDGFKDTSIFKQCVFGCGSKNPATVWNARREAIYAQMTPKLDAPIQLKAAFGEIWQMGYAYGRGEMKDYKRIRKEVEAALKAK